MTGACTANEFVDYIARLYAFAREYRADADHNALVLQFLRHKEYASIQWYALVGGIDYGFVNLVDQSGVAQIVRFQDPVFAVQIKVSHLAASCTGVYEYGQPEATTINRGDITGWAGDWITFFGDWRRAHVQFGSGYDFTQAKLMRADMESSFELTDLMEDADAYILGMQLRAGANIAGAVDSLYGSGARRPRLQSFFSGRFGNRDSAQAAATNALLSDADRLVEAGRLSLIESVGGFPTLLPSMVPAGQLDEFCRGFPDVLSQMVYNERKLLTE